MSPCVAVCVMNTETGFCHGCYRTIEEIGGWMMMTDDRRREVLDELTGRRAEDEAQRAERKRLREAKKRREQR